MAMPVDPTLPPILSEFEPSIIPVPGAVPQPGTVPLYSELPSIARSLGEKRQFLSGLPINPKVANALQELDRQRALRGQRPLSMPKMEQGQLVPGETLEVLRAMPSPQFPMGRSVQPVQEKSSIVDIPGNILSNAAALFRSIPKIPAMAVQTVRDIPQAPRLLSEAIAQGDFQKVAQVPGINLIPGVYTAGNILEGDVQEVIENPLFTALDVAPLAGAKVFRAPANMLDEAGRLVQQPSMYRTLFPKTYSLTSDIGLTRQAKVLAPGETPMVSAWDLAKNRVRESGGGRYQQMIAQQAVRMRGTRAGSRFASSFGSDTRDLMTMISESWRFVQDLADPNSAGWLNRSERLGIAGTAFEMDNPWIRKLDEHNKRFNDEFGVQNYGSKEAWAERREQLAEFAERRPDEIGSLPSYEQDYLQSYRDVGLEMARPYISQSVKGDKRPMIEVPFEVTDRVSGQVRTYNEIYDYGTGMNILKARFKAAKGREFTAINDLVRNPRSVTADEIVQMMENSTLLTDPRVTKEIRARAIEGYAHAMVANGFDARGVLNDVIATRAGRLSAGSITDIRTIVDAMPFQPLMLDDLVEAVWPRLQSGRRIQRSQFSAIRDMVNALGSDDVALIKSEFNRLRDLAEKDIRAIKGADSLPQQFLDLDRTVVNESLNQLAARQRWLKSKTVRKNILDETDIKRLEKAADKIERSSPSARYVPLVGRAIDERIGQVAEYLTSVSRIDPEQAALLVDRINRRDMNALQEAIDVAAGRGVTMFDDIELSTADDLMKQIRSEQVATWRDLMAEGYDPIYIHHVPLGKASAVHTRGVGVSGKTPGWFKERGVDFSPYEGDMAIGLQSQAFELLKKKAEDLVNDTIVNGNNALGWKPFAKTKQQIMDELDPIVQAEALRTGENIDVIQNRLLNRTFVKWEGEAYRNFTTGLAASGGRGRPGVPTSVYKSGDLYVPKNMFDALEKLQEAPKAIAVWDPVMNVFRTTTLLLSPRWQLYNILGNMLTITMAEGFDWVKNLPEAYRAANAVRRGETVAQLGEGVGLTPAQVRTSLGQATKEQTYIRETGKRGAGARGTAEMLLGDERASRSLQWGQKARESIDYLTDLSVRFNAMVDDTTRIAGYMTAYQKYLAKGAKQPEWMADVQRQLREQGVEDLSWTDTLKIQAERDMRKFAYNWDSMTPFERTVARRVFPFYGFFSHMLRYAYQYTMDHPLRVAVAAAFARAEVEDWGTGMPSYLHNLLLIGQMDEQGNRKALNFKGWNPFADLSTLLTPVGWLSQANPIISTLAEQFGIDPRTGEASLYPTATYNEQTGRLELRKRNVLQSFVENVVPQSQVVFNLAGVNPEFNQLATSNPAAAGRLTASALGFPVVVRDVNVPQEIAKAELARRNAARSATNEAIRTGTVQPVRQYPQLAAQVQQLQTQVQANPQAYAQYTLPVAQASIVDLLGGAARTVAGVGG